MPYEGEIEVNNLPQGTTPNQADKIMLIDHETGELKQFGVASLSTLVSDVSFTNAAKNSLIALLEKVAYIDGNGQQYLNELIANLAATVTSISAVFTQGGAIIYDTASLDSLRQYLVVTANYSDNTSSTVNGYTLSGTLTAGTSAITVTYGGQTDTFSVTVTTTTLFSIENEVITTADSVNTGVDIIGTDFDYSVCLDIDFTAVYGDYKIAYQYENASPWRGFSFGRGANNSFNIKAISAFNILNSEASSITKIKAVYTHVKNSGKYILYYRWNTDTTTSTSTITESFVALTKGSDLKIGRHSSTNNWEGTINRASVRNFALTASQAEAFITGN